MVHVLLLVGCAVAIYASCEWFVNAVEWLGRRLRLGPVAVGTVLAAVGTALPESVVTFVAVVLGGAPAQRDIGVGAAMGGPLVLATVAYGVTGLMLLLTRRTRTSPMPARVPVAVGAGASADPPDTAHPGHAAPVPAIAAGDDGRKLCRDQVLFLAIFVTKVGLGLVAFAVKPWLGLLFFAAYAAYVVRELRSEPGGHEDLRPAVPATPPGPARHLGGRRADARRTRRRLRRLAAVRGPARGGRPGPRAGAGGHGTAARADSHRAAGDHERDHLGAAGQAAPGTGEHLRRDDDPGDGAEWSRLLFTPWRFDAPLVLAGMVTMAAMAYLVVLLRRGRLTARTLLGAAGFYGAFAVGLFVV